MSITIPHFEDKKDKVRPDKPTVERDMINAVVYDKSNDSILCLEWPKYDWRTFILGGIDENENPVDAAIREIIEETGYKNLEIVCEIGKTKNSFFAAHKDENRVANNTGLLFIIKDYEQDEVSDEELQNHNVHWVKKNDVGKFVNIEPQL